MSNASDCYQWWRKLFIEVGAPSAWCEGNHFKVRNQGPDIVNFLAELSQSLVFLHICNFCLYSQRPRAFFLTAASQCFQSARVANFSTSFSPYSCVAMGRKSSVRSACCTLLRMLSEQLWIWCLGKIWSFDGLPNLMLKWIWCSSEGSYDDFYLKVVMMIYTLESKVQLWPILCCAIRGLFA